MMNKRITAHEFDPHQYVLDGGWDYGAIEKTARLGIAEADLDIIQEICSDGQAAAQKLEEFCRARVAEAESPES